MATLPLATAFTDSAVTEGDFKTAITDQREFLAGLLGTDGTANTALRTLGSFGNDVSAKSANYTVVVADRGVVFNCTSTFTLSLTAASTLGDGFTFAVINSGSGTITIDPNSTEQIDGANTKSIAAGSWAIVSCTGTAFITMGAVPATGALIGYQVFTASGTYTKATNNPSFVIVEVVGGGGNGAGGTAGTKNNVAGGGGGGGGFSRKKILSASLAASETVTVGSAGGTSSFGTHCSATGGETGVTGGRGGTGGVGSNGDINVAGNGGGSATGASTSAVAGVGGNSFYGGGAIESSVGRPYGGGAGGRGAGVTTQVAGSSGIVIVWEYQ